MFLRRFLLLPLFVVALAAACGEPDTSLEWRAIEIPAGGPLVIGVSVALTGDQSGDARSIERAVRLAVEETGSIKGHALAVDVRDDGCSAEGSVAVAEAFAAMPAVVGVVGPMCSRGCVPASLVYDDAKLMMLTPSCTASALTGQVMDTIVRLAWNSMLPAHGGAKFAVRELDAKRVYAVNDSTFYGKQQRDAFKFTLEREGGNLIADEYVQTDDWDFTALVAEIKAASPDLVYYGGFLPAGRFLVQQLRYHGVRAPFMASDALADPRDFIVESTTAAEGAYITDARPIEGKRAEAFSRAYRERWGEEPGPWAAQAFDAAVTLIEAVEKAAESRDGALEIDRLALATAVLRTDRQGASGKVQFWPNGERRGKDAAVAVIKRVEGDRFVTVKEYRIPQ
jgi:branched-chain amino acid transport system substrate-binding protein